MVSLWIAASLILAQTPRGAGSATPISSRVTEHAYRERHALIIGVSDYAHAPKLAYADDDAKAMQRTLIDKFGFDERNTVLLLDSQATRANIQSAFIDLHKSERVKEQDSILVFLAGHGSIVEDGSRPSVGFFLPVEAPKSVFDGKISVAEAEDKSIRIGRWVRDLFDRSPAKHILVVADFCYGGILIETPREEALPGPSAEPQGPVGVDGLIDAPTENSLISMLRGQGREVLSAGDKLAFEYERNQHGALTGVMLKLLDNMASDADPYSFHLEHIKRYIEYSIEEQSQGRQRPRYHAESTAGRYVFAPAGTWLHYEPTRRRTLANALRDFRQFAASMPLVNRSGPDRQRYEGKTTMSIEEGRLHLLEDQKWFGGTSSLPEHGQIVARKVNVLDLSSEPVYDVIRNAGKYSWLSRPGIHWYTNERAPLVQVDLQDLGAAKPHRGFSDEITISFETEAARRAFVEHVQNVRRRLKEAVRGG